jgi:hypothetical protein
MRSNEKNLPIQSFKRNPILKCQRTFTRVDVTTNKDATSSVLMKPSTSNHYYCSWQLVLEYHQEMQALSPTEENLIVKRCSILSQCGFLPCFWKLHDIAVKMGQERAPIFSLSERWMNKMAFIARTQK